MVRSGADTAQVEALFDVSGHETVRARLVEAGMEAGEQLVVRRVVAASGRHRVYINGALATVQTLAQLTGGLVDISGQHEHYSLLDTSRHIHILDLVLPERPSISRTLAKADRGDFPRPLIQWNELFAEHFKVVQFEPYPLTMCGVTLWNMVYFKGRLKSVSAPKRPTTFSPSFKPDSTSVV